MRALSIVIVVFVVTAAGHVFADNSPWAQGVSDATQKKANALFDEGNQLFAQQSHAPALEKYKAAIAIWDHPMIRFNMAVTEIRLKQILEAAIDLDQALRYGQAPFTADLYHQALDYQALLKNQISDIEVSCGQGEVHVLLDGKPWFACPGKQKLRVMAGEHVLVGERAGYLTHSARLVVAGGAVETHEVKLVPLSDAVILEYPYQRWIPWGITGAGAAIALGGLGFYIAGRSQMDRFQTQFANMCPTGCEANLSDPSHTLLRDERDSAELKGKIAVSMMIAGGAVTVGGVVLAILNRPTRKMPKVEAAPTNGGMTAQVGWSF
jgi:hypothetical protein